MSKSPQDFYNTHNGKGFKNSYGIQCCAGWKEFLNYLGIAGTYMMGNADAQGNSAHQKHYSQNFEVILNRSQLRDGDWYTTWYPGGTGHIAMIFNGGKDSFGQNQTSQGNPSNQQHPSANFKCCTFTGSKWANQFICGYRYKGWSNANFAPTVASATEDVADASTVGASSAAVSISVDASKISPFIVTLHRDSPDKIDWDKLKSNKVIGVLIEGGAYYSKTHATVEFRNPKLSAQVNAAVKAKLPYGLYMTARAKSIEDVKKEMYEFSFLVRKYPPGLGAWMKLDLSNNRTLNDKLIKQYAKELEWLGLKHKVGFLATESQIASQITWANFKEDWYLWVDHHVSDIAQLDKLLDPTFFDIPYTGVPDISSMMSTASSAVSATAGVIGSTAGGSSSGNSLQQKIVANAKANNGTVAATFGMCAAWVRGIYERSGAAYNGLGTAADYWDCWKSSGSSNLTNIPLAAAVIFARSSANKNCGHIGIHVGGGMVAHNKGGVAVWTVDKIASWTGGRALGWVWPSCRDISKM